MSITATLFLLAFAGTLALAVVRSPVYGLYAYVATFYLHPVDRWWGRDLPDLRWALIAAIVTLLATFRVPATEGRPGWLSSTGARFLLLMTLWLWVQNLWALSPAEHWEASLLFTKYLVLFYLMYRLLDSEERLRGFLIAHTLGCLYLGWLVLIAPAGGRLEGVGGPGIDEANALGMHIGTGAFAAAALLVTGPWWSRAMALVALPLILNGLVQTQSRGAFLAFVAGGLAFLYFNPARLRKRWVVAGLVALVALLPAVPANYWERLDTISVAAKDTSEADTSAQTRIDLLKAQWKMFLRYPMGSGHRGTAALSPQYLREDQLTRSRGDPNGPRTARSSHNTVMTILAEQGVPGAMLFVFLCIWLARTLQRGALRMRGPEDDVRRLQLSAVAAMLGIVMVAGLFTDYFKAEVFIWGIAMLAALDGTMQHAGISSATADASKAPPMSPAQPRPTGSHP